MKISRKKLLRILKEEFAAAMEEGHITPETVEDLIGPDLQEYYKHQCEGGYPDYAADKGYSANKCLRAYKMLRSRDVAHENIEPKANPPIPVRATKTALGESSRKKLQQIIKEELSKILQEGPIASSVDMPIPTRTSGGDPGDAHAVDYQPKFNPTMSNDPRFDEWENARPIIRATLNGWKIWMADLAKRVANLETTLKAKPKGKK